MVTPHPTRQATSKGMDGSILHHGRFVDHHVGREGAEQQRHGVHGLAFGRDAEGAVGDPGPVSRCMPVAEVAKSGLTMKGICRMRG